MAALVLIVVILAVQICVLWVLRNIRDDQMIIRRLDRPRTAEARLQNHQGDRNE